MSSVTNLLGTLRLMLSKQLKTSAVSIMYLIQQKRYRSVLFILCMYLCLLGDFMKYEDKCQALSEAYWRETTAPIV